MSVIWVIELDPAPPERAKADLLVAPFFAGERPLRGAASRIDWRLCGHLSAMLARGVFTGEVDELVLVPVGPSLRAPRALLLGLGPREGFSTKTLRRGTALAVARAAALRAGIVALALPSEALSGLAAEKAAAAAVIGAGEALAARPFPLRLRLVVEPTAMPRVRQTLAELVPRIEMDGVAVRLAAAEPETHRLPAGISHRVGNSESDGAGAFAAAAAAVSAKLPSPP